MAIVNRTPDSFYDHGATHAFDAAVERAGAVIAAGAGIVDIGGVKAGPGEFVSISEEIDRVVPVIAAVHEAFPETTISVDTWRAEIAELAVDAGAALINDTWAGHDPELVEVAGDRRVGYVCSHTGGVVPRTRPYRVHYDDVVSAVIDETTRQAEHAVSLGVPEDKIFIYPTHDFGKNTFHGLELLRRIDDIVTTGWPVLIALSNKDFIGETLARSVDKRVPGTLAATAWSAERGVAAFRSHQVEETIDVIRMTAAIQGTTPPLKTTRGLA
ncbi:dihydropteroate synthase [Corynebacterium silvaticum]|uniref:Inactive dihydropteroate synthase 2 n=1 Tax=Corynebacterium silvaticum TaxID=2320431 RepID=A0A7Y4P9J6_9CORY|nr:dihydropteroate synthase [Corynebacterium silvaticum]ARU45920.1 dihydropteroate synthase [Corynebacterium silvaticum]NON69841.1 dihydropteroate synthase [Corynebacterium silvaticum]UWH01035.1 dihydropteroate synthase [Corynebacterium silvaticum]UWH03082.1 dihydropteroate synthase [Corynebacterium silvaticum]UWH05118.1 dihydropteroate synthase [Corynebacterium silvaticum]